MNKSLFMRALLAVAAILSIGILSGQALAHSTTPCIELLKKVSVDGGDTFHDADSCDGAPTSHGIAEYELTVTNCGTVDLFNITIIDPDLGINEVVIDKLPADEVLILTKKNIEKLLVKDPCGNADEFKNTAYVSGCTEKPDNKCTYECPEDSTVTDKDSACVKCDDTCALEVRKYCFVPPPPLSGDLECEAKIAATRLLYTGPDSPNATVVFEGKSDAIARYSVDLVSDETVLAAQNGFTIDARPGDLGSKMTVSINGVEEVIHTSCSAPYIAGMPAPLDKPKGDPSPNWSVVSFIDKNGTQVQLPDNGSPPLTSVCEIVLGPVPSCKKTGKPKNLTWRYTGGTCWDSTFKVQKDFECSGTAVNPELPVYVKPEKGDPFWVDPGTDFTISLKQSKKITLSNNGREQKLKIHTSCSQPIAVGMTAGPLTLVAMDGKGISGEVEYTFEVKNTGNEPVYNVTVDDPKLELLKTIDEIASGATVTIKAMDVLSETTTNTVRVEGYTTKDSGAPAPPDCYDEAESTVWVLPPLIPPGSCADGKPKELRFRYMGDSCSEGHNYQKKGSCTGDPNGAEPVDIVVTKDSNKVMVSPSKGIMIGDLVSFKGVDNKFKSELKFEIRQGGRTLQTLNIHTSCSDELAEGDQFGSMFLETYIPR